MPATADIATPVLREITAQAPRVFIAGTEYAGMTCLAVEDCMGAHPSTAVLRAASFDNANSATDIAGPITLNRVNWPWKYGSRVIVLDAVTERPVFVGSISGRKDQGQSDVVLWDCVDDRDLLRRIPVRGCFVYDATTASVMYLRRYTPRCNPNGAWNCTWATVAGALVPMFTATAAQNQQRQTYSDAQRKTYTETPAQSALTPWTPRLWLQYLRWTLFDAVGAQIHGWSKTVSGAPADSGCRGIAARLQWDAAANAIKGDVAPASSLTTDPLDRALPDTTWKGHYLDALTRVLEIAGTHTLVLDPTANGAADWNSSVRFAPIGQTAISETDRAALTLPLYRSGTPADCNTVYDFSLSEEPPEADAVLAEGQPVRQETSWLAFTGWAGRAAWQASTAYPADALIGPGAGAYGYTSGGGTSGTSEPTWGGATVSDGGITWTKEASPLSGEYVAIIPLWTQTTEANVQRVIAGDGTNAYRPSTEGGTPGTVVSDIGANTKEALALARSIYPDWRTHFALSGAALAYDALNGGYDGRYVSPFQYPMHNGPRPILPELLQWFSGSGAQTVRVPVRLQVYQNGAWIEAPRENGIQLLPDGTFQITGIADNMDGASEQTPTVGACLWSGTVATSPLLSGSQFLRLCVAYPLDHRVQGYAETATPSFFDEDYSAALNGAPLAYVDAPDGWREDHQYQSKPFASGTGAAAYSNAGETVDANGITGLLPPGTEQVDAQDTAQRQVNTVSKPRRRSSWKLAGIRPEWRAGQWVSRVKVLQGPDGDTDYDLDGPIGTVLYDYMHQQTVIGGLLSMLPSYAVPAGRGALPPMM